MKKASVFRHRRCRRASRRTIPSALVAALATTISAGFLPAVAFGQAFTFTTGDLDYSENFNSMFDTGTFADGWTAIRGGGSGGTLGETLSLRTGYGESTTGGIYNVGPNFGTEGEMDRAFGSLASGTTIPWFGASFLNNTGLNIGTLSFTGFMEQWRQSTNALVENVVFEYSLDATSLNSGVWTPLSSFDLVEKLPAKSQDPFQVNGNLEENRTAISGTVNLAWANNSSLWIRWRDADNTGSDGLYAIDDFSLVVTTASAPKNLVWNPQGSAWNTTNTNWLETSTARSFTNGDNVTFNDAGLASGGNVVVDSAGLAPGNINVTNTSGTYTFSGGPLNGSGLLTKTSAGTLVLATTYNKSIQVEGGIVRTAAADLIGDSSAIVVRSGATFDFVNNNDAIGNVQLQGGTITTGTGTVTLNGDIAAQASENSSFINGIINTGGAIRTITVEDGAAETDLVINAKIVGTQRLTFGGPGSIQLNTDNSGYTGNFQLIGGNSGPTILLGNSKAFGNAQLFLNGGTISATTEFTGVNAIANTVSIGGNSTLTGSPVEWLGDWGFFNTQNVRLTVENVTTVNGSFIGEDDTLRINGNGTLKVADVTIKNIELEGATLVLSGSLSADKFDVESGTLSGTGTVLPSPNNPLTIGDFGGEDDAKIAPGNGGIGTLTTGSILAQSDAVFEFELNSTLGTADMLKLSESATLTLSTDGGAENAPAVSLQLIDLGNTALQIGRTFTLIDNGGSEPIWGSFIGSGENDRFSVGVNQFELDYAGGDGNDLVLRVVPEPGSAALLTFGAAVLSFRRRNRRTCPAS